MKEPTHTRNGSLINHLETCKTVNFKTVNKAKKESRRIQLDADSALGRGTVRVIKS